MSRINTSVFFTNLDFSATFRMTEIVFVYLVVTKYITETLSLMMSPYRSLISFTVVWFWQGRPRLTTDTVQRRVTRIRADEEGR